MSERTGLNRIIIDPVTGEELPTIYMGRVHGAGPICGATAQGTCVRKPGHAGLASQHWNYLDGFWDRRKIDRNAPEAA